MDWLPTGYGLEAGCELDAKGQILDTGYGFVAELDTDRLWTGCRLGVHWRLSVDWKVNQYTLYAGEYAVDTQGADWIQSVYWTLSGCGPDSD